MVIGYRLLAIGKTPNQEQKTKNKEPKGGHSLWGICPHIGGKCAF